MDLFGNSDDPPAPHTTPLERKRMARRAAERPRGYADRPGTGPEGETCGTCVHHVTRSAANKYHKCALTRACWTAGPKTDIRVRSPACWKWEAPRSAA